MKNFITVEEVCSEEEFNKIRNHKHPEYAIFLSFEYQNKLTNTEVDQIAYLLKKYWKFVFKF